jgi:hypothetical protein
MALDRVRAMTLAQRVLRAVQAIFAVLVLACASKAMSVSLNWSHVPAGFLVFVSVTALAAAVFFLVVSWRKQLQQTFSGVVETSVSAVLVVFWLSASAKFVSYTNFCNDLSKPSYAGYDSAMSGALHHIYLSLKEYCAVRSATVAFGFLSGVLWMVSTALAGLEMKAGKGLRVPGIKANTAQHTQGACCVRDDICP